MDIKKAKRFPNKLPPKGEKCFKTQRAAKFCNDTKSSNSEIRDWDIGFPLRHGGLFILIQIVFGQIIGKT